jgi:ubiquitin-like-conjugating enzyme ATG3
MDSLNDAKTKIHGTFQQMVNAVKAVPTVSKFLEEGILTPDEFIQAGDLLVARCPTWSWQPGDPARAVSYLPKNKQFLLTRNGMTVPVYFFPLLFRS